ncbi:MAG: hypothetical protein F6K18_18495 [Okeania sp. SIO2C2]|uniref:hypothetical protein n=1 Tax=Okeania sp. SIO2C2 TaxID=2607787 RepID=UPI0013BC9493|nr:hypothetical protein [Okeania sp. SIO2C2]NEP88664.1 hypothetical protein [Okeania sp. SIO2C2]
MKTAIRGEDVFRLTVDTGNNGILDFEDDIDLIELREGLTFSPLAIINGEDNTISIIVASSGEIISTITRADEIAIASDDLIEGFKKNKI